MDNLINNAVLSCTPNDAVIAKFVAILPQEMLDTIKADNISKFDFALFIVRTAVMMEVCDLTTAWDLVFGAGSYDKFKHCIYDILEAEFHPQVESK